MSNNTIHATLCSKGCTHAIHTEDNTISCQLAIDLGIRIREITITQYEQSPGVVDYSIEHCIGYENNEKQTV